jgi:hypothetical protein
LIARLIQDAFDLCNRPVQYKNQVSSRHLPNFVASRSFVVLNVFSTTFSSTNIFSDNYPFELHGEIANFDLQLDLLLLELGSSVSGLFCRILKLSNSSRQLAPVYNKLDDII